jgi:hypothetical protein
VTKFDIEVHELKELIQLFKDLKLTQGCQLILNALSTWATKVIDPSSGVIAEEVITYTLSTFPNHFHSTILNEWNARRYWEYLIIQFSRRMNAMTIPAPQGERPIRWKTNEHSIDPNELSRRAQVIAAGMSRLPIADALDLSEEIVREWAARHDLAELRWHVANYSYRDPKMADQLDESWTEARISGYIPFLLASMTEH